MGGYITYEGMNAFYRFQLIRINPIGGDLVSGQERSTRYRFQLIRINPIGGEEKKIRLLESWINRFQLIRINPIGGETDGCADIVSLSFPTNPN